MVSQLSGDLPSTLDNRSAISGDILLSPFNNLFKVDGDTPKLSATFLTLRSKGLIYVSCMPEEFPVS